MVRRSWRDVRAGAACGREWQQHGGCVCARTGRGGCLDPLVGDARNVDQHRSIGGEVEVGVLAPLPVLSKLPSMVPPEADHRVVGVTLRLELL